MESTMKDRGLMDCYGIFWTRILGKETQYVETFL
jgi:hypothetical protein